MGAATVPPWVPPWVPWPVPALEAGRGPGQLEAWKEGPGPEACKGGPQGASWPTAERPLLVEVGGRSSRRARALPTTRTCGRASACGSTRSAPSSAASPRRRRRCARRSRRWPRSSRCRRRAEAPWRGTTPRSAGPPSTGTLASPSLGTLTRYLSSSSRLALGVCLPRFAGPHAF